MLTRREALQRSAVGFGSLALASLLAGESSNRQAEADEQDTAAKQIGGAKQLGASRIDPLAPKPPHHVARAKRIIFLFMSGGPSQVDTFDPKPLLDRDHGKPLPFAKPQVQFNSTGNLLKSPWKFQQYGESGLWVSELFPHLAHRVDDLCMIHSIHGSNPAHGGAVMKIHTGSDNFIRPSIGSWVSYGLGTENASLPAFVTICPTLAFGGINNWNAAFLPAVYSGTPLGNASVASDKAKVRYISNSRLSRDLQRLQLERLAEVNRRHSQQLGAADASLDARINSFELAFRMQSELPKVEDLSGETAETHKLYGMDDPTTANFGRMCLMARRFAEAGVRFIQVTHNDDKVQWDQHSGLKAGHEKNAREVDKPIAGLLADLKARGMLEDTLIWWGGEFGRTPTAEGTDGRDHNPEGFTMWLAGGGVKGGFRYGSSDDYGYFAAENKVHIHDLHATMLHLLGLDHERLTYRYAGRDFRLTDVAGEVVRGILV